MTVFRIIITISWKTAVTTQMFFYTLLFRDDLKSSLIIISKHEIYIKVFTFVPDDNDDDYILYIIMRILINFFI